ncbi:FkbM family methyltransferase [Chloroflexota bacterium]
MLAEVGEHKMFVQTRDIGLGRPLLVLGSYERGTTRLFKETIQEGMTVIDIGANIGYFTLIAARLVGGEGRVFAFEPEPHNFDLLVKNLELNEYSNVIPVSKAVSNRNGSARLYLDKNNWGAHSLSEECPTHFSGVSVEVEIQTLDDFLKDYGGKVDFIKIDAQGAEPAIIQGMTNVIKHNKDLKMVVEFWPEGLRHFGSSPEEFLDRLVGYGIKLYRIDERNGALTPVDVTFLIKKYHSRGSRNLLAIRT